MIIINLITDALPNRVVQIVNLLGAEHPFGYLLLVFQKLKVHIFPVVIQIQIIGQGHGQGEHQLGVEGEHNLLTVACALVGEGLVGQGQKPLALTQHRKVFGELMGINGVQLHLGAQAKIVLLYLLRNRVPLPFIPLIDVCKGECALYRCNVVIFVHGNGKAAVQAVHLGVPDLKAVFCAALGTAVNNVIQTVNIGLFAPIGNLFCRAFLKFIVAEGA